MARWQQVKIGDVCVVERGGSPRPIEKFITEDKNGINWIKIGDTTESMYITKTAQKIIPEGAKKSRFVQSGDFLLSNSMSFGRPYILSIDGCIHDGWLVLRDKDNLFDKHFLYYCLSTPVTYAKFKSMAVGGVVNNLNSEMVRNVEIPLPPLEEQRRIAALLDKVSDLIAKRRAQLDKLDLLVKARFVEITENSETVPTRMGDVATYINGYAFKPTNWSKNGLPIIRIQNLNNENAEYNYFDGVLPEKYLVRRGDVLVSWATHLEAYIWKGHDAWLNQHIFKVVFDKMPINDVYFVYSTEEALRQAFRNAHGFKPTMEHIKRSDFEDAVIRLPNVEVQNKFAKFATQVDKSKLTIQQSLDKLETLKKALVQQYFG